MGEQALKFGRWSIYQKILFSKMGTKMKEQLETTRAKLESKDAIVHQFLSLRSLEMLSKNDENNDSNVSNVDLAMESILETVINLINERLPISDDLLLVCWKYELMKLSKNDENFNPLNTRLWIAISNVLNNVLELPLNKKDYIWFSSYLLHSSIWYQDSISKTEKEQIIAKKESIERRLYATNLRIFCHCGEERKLAMPLLIYSGGITNCVFCEKKIGGLDYVYHCLKSSKTGNEDKSVKDEHPDYCVSCAKQVAQKIEMEEETKTISLV